MFHADTHIHSRFSRACSKDCDLRNLAWWAVRKGITVVGTGDFTHPAWREELTESLVPAEPGLFRLRPDLEGWLRRETPASCDRQVRFMLSVEISTIYRRADRTRKVHHLLYAPSFDAAGRITTALSKIGNLASDGRPILGLDSRDLLEITLNGGPGCYLVPAHVWTPWFAALGSRSGFDSVAECYADLADHVFAIETGLSSDPPMNWMCSVLDSYRLVSNSDAHSPPMLGREATTFSTSLDYFAMAEALRTGDGLAGTLEFYPEEGKYHLDGHRKCGVRLDPEETREYGGICPKCDKPLTVGVLHRVSALADRPEGYRPPDAASSTNLIRLPEIIGELMSVGPQSKKVGAEVSRLVGALGPEIGILTDVPHDDLVKTGGGLFAEAIARLRRGEVIRDAGYDGEYGTIRLMQPDELVSTATLFDLPPAKTSQPAKRAGIPERAQASPAPDPGPGAAPAGKSRANSAPADTSAAGAGTNGSSAPPDATATRGDSGSPTLADAGGVWQDATPPAPAAGTGLSGPEAAAATLLDGLDPEQRAAATAAGPLLIVAGPGTGKTRTLTHRIAYLIASERVRPSQCLALTFTRRAAEEMRLRLAALLGPESRQLTVTTFHGLGLQILRENAAAAGLDPGFGVADEATALEVATELAGGAAAGRKLLAGAAADPAARADFTAALRERGLVDFDDLTELPLALLRREPDVAAALRDRWPAVSVDEYQDVNEAQYDLLRLLTAGAQESGAQTAGARTAADLTVIGDPDQAIYGFRGSDVAFFLRFGTDFPAAQTARLSTNYRSAPGIVAGAAAAIAPSTLVPDRVLRAAAPSKPATAGKKSRPAPIVVHEAPTEQAEAEWITAEIERLLGGASFHALDSGRADGHGHGGLGLADVAILYRTDSQAAALIQALTRAGLPFQKRSHDRLSHRAGVADIVRELRLTAPESSPAAKSSTAAESSPAGTAGTAAGDPAADQAATGSAVATGTDGAETTADAGGASTVTSLLRAAVRRLTTGAPAAVATDLRAAGEILGPLADRCDRDLDRFLTEISVGAEADALDTRAEAVTLLTLHAAKGLEFDVVFLAGCERGLLPLWFPGDDDRDEAEERRLFFVGMTRARTRLFLTCAATRSRFGTDRPAGPSPFLAAIGPALLQHTDQPKPRPKAAHQPRLF